MKDIYFMNLLSLRLGIKKTREGLWNCKCVICGDSKYKSHKKRMFFIKRDKGITVYCHNCGYSRSLKNFIEDQAPDLIDEYNLFGFVKKKDIAFKLEEIIKKDPEKKPKKSFITTDELINLTKGFHELKEDHPARKYVEHRMIPFKKVRFCSNLRKFHKELKEDDEDPDVPCLIIPFYKKDSTIEILQARFFDPNLKPKYLTIKFNDNAKKIYNSDFVDYKQLVWILEGPIDSMFVPNSIAMAGADLSPEINAEYCWVYDNEPGNKEIVNKMIRKINDGYKIVIWNKEDHYKDINEGIVKNLLDINSVCDILKERVSQGLVAKLKLSQWRK